MKNKNNNSFQSISDKEAKKLGIFILEFNNTNEGLIYNLNIRDVKKILKRFYYQKENNESYYGFK